MKFRRSLVELFAVLMGQEIEFPEDKRRIEADYQLKLAQDGYRLVREVRQNGTVHWFIEEYFTSNDRLRHRIPSAPYVSTPWINGHRSDKIWTWARHPKDYPSMEEAIDGLNNKIRKNEVSETTYMAVSNA